MSEATSFTLKISLTPYHGFLKLLNQLQEYNIKEIKTPKVTFQFSFKNRSFTFLFGLLFSVFQTVISKSFISIKSFDHPIISRLFNFLTRILEFFTFLYLQTILRLDCYHDRFNRDAMKPPKKAEQMQDIPIYAMAHAPPFPRKPTSNQLQPSLPPNFVESIRLNSKINAEGIINTRFERSYLRTSSSSSYSPSAPSSYSSSASSALDRDFQRIRRRKKKLKKIRISTRSRFASFDTSSDGDADVEKDDNEDESKIVSKIKQRKSKKLNSSHPNHHSQLHFQLHSFWILICFTFSMMFFKIQSS